MKPTIRIVELPAAVFAAVRTVLTRVPVIHGGLDGDVIDLQGLAFKAAAGGRDAAGADITVSTLLSSRTHEGRVEFALNGQLTQMDLPKAREVVGMLQGAIEAAVTDQMLFQFLTDRVGLSPEAAAAALLDFRELRQGSRGTVYPT